MYAAILLFIGIGFLLAGLVCMRFGLNRILSRRIKLIFTKMTVTPWRGLFVGICTAALLQSSTAVSLITIGLVSANYLTFHQSIGIILGANIGTCTTVQLMTLPMSPEWLIPLFAGCVLAMSHKKLRFPALAATGLIFMFLGLNVLGSAVTSISEADSLVQTMLEARNPYYGILAGIIATMLFQSSSAATGLLIVLAEKGFIDMATAAYVVYGNNIGSCISSLIVGAASPLAAKRVAAAHIMLNVFGCLLFLPFTKVLTMCAAYLAADFAGQIALMHTIFNILCSLLVMPFIKQYAKLIMFIVPK